MTDTAGILSTDTEEQLTQLIYEFESDYSHMTEFKLVTVNDTGVYTLDELANALFTSVIEDEENGVLVVISNIEEDGYEISIEVGSDLTTVFTPEVITEIENQIIPLIDAGDYDTAAIQSFETITSKIYANFDETADVVEDFISDAVYFVIICFIVVLGFAYFVYRLSLSRF